MGGEEGGQGEGKPTQRVVGLVGGLLGPGTRRWGAKSHPTSRWTRWVGLGVETARWGGEEGGQGEGEPTQRVKRLVGCREGPGGGRVGKGPPNESLDSLGAVEAGDGGVGGEVGPAGGG